MPAKKSAPPLNKNGLQLEEHRRFQEKFWTVERWCWIAFGAIVVAAILGFTGAGGQFSHGTSTSTAGIIDSPRVARWQATDIIKIVFAPGGDERSLSFSSGFSEIFRFDDIVPPPERSEAGPDGQRLIFTTLPGASATVTLHVRPYRAGPASYSIALDADAPVSLFTLVLP